MRKTIIGLLGLSLVISLSQPVLAERREVKCEYFLGFAHDCKVIQEKEPVAVQTNSLQREENVSPQERLYISPEDCRKLEGEPKGNFCIIKPNRGDSRR